MHFLISGISTSGKSTFCRWLEEKKGFLHLDVEKPGVLDRHGLATAWDALFDASTSAASFVQALERFKRPVVIDWGFPPECLNTVRKLSEAGVMLWWFAADWVVVRRKFQLRRYSRRSKGARKALACLMNFRFNAVPQELAGGNMSPMRETAGRKAAATQKRNAAKRQAAAKKAASTRKGRAAGKNAAATRKRRAAGQKAARTRVRRGAATKAAATRARKKEAAVAQPVQVQEPPAPEPQVQATPETSIPE